MNMYPDTVTIIKDNGEKFDIKCSISSDFLITRDVAREIACNDIIERKLSNGVLETYKVLDPEFHESSYSFKATYQIKIEKCNIPKKSPFEVNVNNTNNNNIYNSANANASNENIITISTLSQLSSQVSQSTTIENKKEIQELISQLEDAKDEGNDESYFDLFFKLLDKLSGSGLIPEWLVKSAKFAQKFINK